MRALWLAVALSGVTAGAFVGHAQDRGSASTETALARRVRAQVDDAIAAKQLPGAVVLVGHGDRVLVREAIGARATLPSAEPMTADTLFDAASLTKVVATTTSVMQLVEDGRLRLNDPVSRYVPGFERYGKRDITVRHLLTHSSGLRPDIDLADPWSGADHALALIVEEVPVARPDERVIYSDINFELLGRIVERVSGLPLDRYAQDHIFTPLGMRDTGFRPAAALVPRIAPTERCPAGEPCVPGATGSPGPPMLRGVVHDPTARRMGGVAGHAGLFTTADDLGRFCRMLLGQGTLDGTRILSPLTVARMLAPSTPAAEPNVRGLGWDLDSSFSSNRGELFPIGSFGHTGFTGTSVWIDPATSTYVVVLSNRVHPEGKGDATPLRARLATIAAAASAETAPAGASAARPPKPPVRLATAPARAVEAAPRAPVLTGIDVLRTEGFARLAGAKVALLTNHTGVARDGTSTIDLLHAAKNLTLVALFSPEHGIRGTLDEKVPSGTDEKTGLPIYSLYGDTRRPTAAMLAGVDTIVVDLQDIGVRFYTYA
ncbi:MAG: serine hydrolase, partial [Vicinamibacteraceae bacterium]